MASPKIWSISTSSKIQPGSPFAIKNANQLVWDFAIVAASEESANQNLAEYLSEFNLQLEEIESCLVYEDTIRSSDSSRSQAMQIAVKQAAYLYVQGLEGKQLLAPAWRETNEERKRRTIQKQYLWAISTKENFPPESPSNIDGSKYSYSKFLVPADTKDEALGLVDSYLLSDKRKIIEVYYCDIYDKNKIYSYSPDNFDRLQEVAKKAIGCNQLICCDFLTSGLMDDLEVKNT